MFLRVLGFRSTELQSYPLSTKEQTVVKEVRAQLRQQEISREKLRLELVRRMESCVANASIGKRILFARTNH